MNYLFVFYILICIILHVYAIALNYFKSINLKTNLYLFKLFNKIVV